LVRSGVYIRKSENKCGNLKSAPMTQLASAAVPCFATLEIGGAVEQGKAQSPCAKFEHILLTFMT